MKTTTTETASMILVQAELAGAALAGLGGDRRVCGAVVLPTDRPSLWRAAAASLRAGDRIAALDAIGLAGAVAEAFGASDDLERAMTSRLLAA